MQKRLKVAQVITRMDWAGSPDIVRIMCLNLRSMYDVRLITGPGTHLSLKTKKFLEEFKDNVIIVPSLRRDINPVLDFIALIHLYRIFRKERFDLVHTNTAKAGILGRIAAFLAGTPRIIHMPHGHNFYGYFGPALSRLIIWLERFAAGFTDRLVVLTELEKNDYMSFGIKKSEDIEVVPSGLELEGFRALYGRDRNEKRRELGISPQEKIVGMVSRLETVKGPEYFIEAANSVAKKISGVRFFVVGEGSLSSGLKERSQQLGLKDKVVFLGWRDDALDIIFALDLLVQPSLNEAVGRVLLEAQGLGVPVIGTSVGGIPEIIKDGSTGFIVRPKDAEGLSRSICDLLENEEKRNMFSKEARMWVEERFSSDRMMEKIYFMYIDIMNKKVKNMRSIQLKGSAL